MKRFGDVVDQISTLYQSALVNSYQSLLERFKANCQNFVCFKVSIYNSEGEHAKEEDDLHLQSNPNFIFNVFRKKGGWPREVLDDLNYNIIIMA